MHPVIMHWIGFLHRWLYVLTGGNVGSQLGSLKFLLLTTRGSQSGRLRTLPLLYLEDGENFLIPASSGGNPRNPAWLGNIKADSDVSVRVGSKVLLMKGILADEPDRTRFYKRFVETMSHYAEYEERSGRVIPVVVLSKR